MKRLENKVAIITGGAGGIGLTAANLFLGHGCKVLLADVNKPDLSTLIDKFTEEYVDFLKTDVSSVEDNKKLVQKAKEKWGRLDIFFANAGVEGMVKPITEYPEDEFDRLMAINVRGTWLGLKYALPAIAESGGGSMIVTSSVAGLRGAALVSPYVTSKHALTGMVKSVAAEAADAGVRVNSIHPSPVDNRMMRSLEEGFAPGAGTEVKKQLEQQIPLKRYADNDDIANLALFLASDESSFITGANYAIDGGMNAV